MYLKILLESIRQASDSMLGNKLRTFLSLLGIAIGIFCIIAVLSAVNSLEKSVKGGIGELGNDVVIVDVMPWDEDPGMNYWKYAKRPSPQFFEYEFLSKKLEKTGVVAFTSFFPGKTIKYKENVVEGVFTMASSYSYPDVQKINIEKGRYFTPTEFQKGANKIIIGHKTATELFGALDPIGRDVRLYGQKFQVIGVLKEEGENPFNMFNYDEVAWLGYHNAKRYVDLENASRFEVAQLIYAKPLEGFTDVELKDELRGALRQIRKLRPLEEDNFSLVGLSMLNNIVDNIFAVLYFAGFLIGIFALIVGMVSVANIMFVSVKERTNIIGIKKAIGAKRFVILLEFLIESVILCLIGGIIGLMLVFLVLKIISTVIPFSITPTFSFIIIGIGTSVSVGIISGIIPAMKAAKLDPVVAIRQ